mgnify:CR=1 FL=1
MKPELGGRRESKFNRTPRVGCPILILASIRLSVHRTPIRLCGTRKRGGLSAGRIFSLGRKNLVADKKRPRQCLVRGKKSKEGTIPTSYQTFSGPLNLGVFYLFYFFCQASLAWPALICFILPYFALSCFI